ncbi:MAG: non-canonical purine NTP diphosphatase [Mediterranea sp.]|jgi:XTP/dITP diphosphohydrolase|nr:non-canonical purine NTP diphosphatase [Mediterranea sp.]
MSQKRRLVFATNNAHKLEEVAAILGDRIELLSLSDIGCHADIPETADTLEGNALLKSSYVYKEYGLDCFADDTGLEVAALGGAPGVYSARYAGGEGHDSAANMRKLLHELEGQPDRRAQFRTAISLILNGEEYLFEGVVRGEIITEARGATGFGYDPLFRPDGYDKTFAELGAEVKNRISHRAQAVRKLCEFLSKTNHSPAHH